MVRAITDKKRCVDLVVGGIYSFGGNGDVPAGYRLLVHRKGTGEYMMVDVEIGDVGCVYTNSLAVIGDIESGMYTYVSNAELVVE